MASSMHLDLQKKEESKAASANSGMKCSLCDFTATRINVLIMHTKTHSEASKQKSLVSKPSKEIAMTPGKGRGPTTPVKSRATPTTKKATPADKKATPKTSKVPKTPKTPKAPAEKKTTPKAANSKAKNTPKAT